MLVDAIIFESLMTPGSGFDLSGLSVIGGVAERKPFDLREAASGLSAVLNKDRTPSHEAEDSGR